MLTDNRNTAPLAPRIAQISIAGFWLFYFVIWSLRGAVVYQYSQASMMGSRAIVSLGSAGLTAIFYLLMRLIPAMRLGRSIAAALALAVPAAILYSALNYYVFENYYRQPAVLQHWSPATSGTSFVRSPPPGAMSVGSGTMQAHPGEKTTLFEAIADQAANGYFFFIAWAALYLALCYSAEVAALERGNAKLRAAAQSAELRALRYQINPHFLFNTLNSLSSLLLGGKREQAEGMILNLATFFRTSLTGDPTQDVRLSEEIELQRLYLDIERVRFPDRLLVEIDVPAALLGACIPGLILQPLIENAVKYAVAVARRKVTIRIAAREAGDGLLLTVEDDGDPVDPAKIAAGTGVGLRNVRDRLTARYAEKASCHWRPKMGGGFEVMLMLPLVHRGC